MIVLKTHGKYLKYKLRYILSYEYIVSLTKKSDSHLVEKIVLFASMKVLQK